MTISGLLAVSNQSYPTANKPEMAIPDYLVFVGNFILPISLAALWLLAGL